MTNRERFRAALAFEETDRPCHVEYGFWNETYDRWRAEGLPDNVAGASGYDYDCNYVGPGPDLFEHFDITRFAWMSPESYYLPPFDRTVIEEADTYRIVIDKRGVKSKVSKVGVSMPQFLEYPIKTRRDYEVLKEERLQPDVSKRYPADWDKVAEAVRDQQEVVVCVHMDGFFAHPRELMGVERMLTMFYDDPELMRDIINYRCDFLIQLYERQIRDTRPDFAFVWEDMCYKNGPLCSPNTFREFMLPAYQKLTSFIKGMGVENIVVDSDGDVSKLVPLWLEGGVTGLLPFEVKAGMDVVRLGKEFPRLQIFGGIDKHALEKTISHIDSEIERVLPAMMRRGGYVVTLDHWVQPEIPLSNYEYYVKRVRDFRS